MGFSAIYRQRGQIAVEWAMLTVILVVALFAPIPGSDESIVGMLMQAIRNFYANMSFLISLP